MSTQKAILEFDLTDLDAADAFRVAIDGAKYKNVLTELDIKLRNDYKYGTEGHKVEYAEELRALLRELAHTNGVSIE